MPVQDLSKVRFVWNRSQADFELNLMLPSIVLLFNCYCDITQSAPPPSGEPQDLGIPPDCLHCCHGLPEPAGEHCLLLLVLLLLLLIL